MNAFNIEMFINAAVDKESSQYRILHALQNIRSQYASNCIYPALGNLIKLADELKEINKSAEQLKENLPRNAQKVDLDKKQILFALDEAQLDHWHNVEEVIDWALPLIGDAIEEGKTIYEFVDENLSLEIVGILPTYLAEGYCFIPDNEFDIVHLVKYEISIFTHADEKYRSLKTKVLESMPQQGLLRASAKLKSDLIAKYRDLPNPATYRINTSLDFSFHNTILPVAKRKLIQSIH